MLQNHLSQEHLDIYIATCKIKGWIAREEVARASINTLGPSETVVKEDRLEYSKEALLEALIAFIVANDQVCKP